MYMAKRTRAKKGYIRWVGENTKTFTKKEILEVKLATPEQIRACYIYSPYTGNVTGFDSDKLSKLYYDNGGEYFFMHNLFDHSLTRYSLDWLLTSNPDARHEL